MAKNTSNSPGADGQDSIGGTSQGDSLTGGNDSDVVSGGLGDDLLQGDQGITGTWFFETFDYNFGSSAGQAFDMENGTQTGAGYVSDFNEDTLTNTMRGTGGNPGDFGIIYTSTINVVAGGTYTFSTRSDDGSTIQIFDENGVALDFNNQSGGTLPYMNNDFHQAATTRSGTVELDANTTYTIQIRYWENGGGDVLSANVSGPDTGGSTESLLTTDMLGDPPPPDYSTTGTPLGVEGNDTLYGGGGNDTLLGDGGGDVLFGDNGGGAGGGSAAWTYEYYDLPNGGYSNLAAAGFTLNGGRDNSFSPTTTGQTNSFNPSDYDTGDRFALKFTSELTVTTGGTYTFSTSSDDGSKLFVNGVEVVDNDGLQATATETGTIGLSPGTYVVEIIYFENAGQQTLSATLAGPDTGGPATDLATYGALTTLDVEGDDQLFGGDGDDQLFGEDGQDTLDGGADDDTLDGGLGDDRLTGGAGDDTFLYAGGDGADTITDFNVGNSGGTGDGDQTNNDFVDLSPFYNDATRAAVNAAGGSFSTNLQMLRADAADGRLDGLIDGVDYSAQIGDIDLSLEDGFGNAVTGGDLTEDNTNVTCFAAGTSIRTLFGERPIETLSPGDFILTADGDARPLRLSLQSHVSAAQLADCPTLRPVRIPAGALGNGLPRNDLWVSRQHRMLVRSKVAQRMFGQDEVLVAAIKLVGHAGIEVDLRVKTVDYFHLVFAQHEVIFADGAPSESFYPGREAIKALPEAAREEFQRLFPDVALSDDAWPFARPVPKGKHQRHLIKRISTNQKPVVDAA